MDMIRAQLAEHIKTVSEADLKATLLSWIETYQGDRAIDALQQTFAKKDSWAEIDDLVGSIEAPSD